LLDKANDDTDPLATIIRAQLLEAKERREAVANPAQLNQLIGDLVGPFIVTSEGELLAVGATKNPAHVNDVHGVIAGARSDPACAIVGWLFREQSRFAA
jgi:hypothetical protein